MNGMRRKNMRNLPKEKTDFKSLIKLLQFIKKYIPFIVIAIVLAVGGAVCTIIGPEKISDLTNLLTSSIFSLSGVDMHEFVNVCVTLIIIYAAGAIAGYGSQFIMASVTQRTSQKLRTAIDKKINKVPLRYFDTTTKGDLLSRITNDVDIISQTLGSSTANIVSAVALFVGVVYKMFETNWLLSLVTIGTSVFGFVFMGAILSKSQKYFNRKQEDLGTMEGQIEEVFANQNIVTSFCGKKSEMKRFVKTNGDLFVDNSKSQFLSGMMMPIMNFVGNLSYALIFIVGVALIVNGSNVVNLGTIMAFVLYSRLFSQPLTTFAQSMTSIQQASAASRRVFEFVSSPEMESEEKSNKLGNVRGDVKFVNVRFGYLPDKTIIHDFSASLKAGQKVAIVGPTGAGKTTIVNLLMRFYELEAPKLIVGGKITDCRIFDNGKPISFFVKDGMLFSDGKPTEYKVSGLPENEPLVFDGDFALCSGEEKFCLPVVTGDELDNTENIELGVAYYGDIFVDGVPVSAMKRNDVHDMFDMILQDTWLFGGTIRENLVFNQPDVSEEKLNEVCSALGLKRFIDNLPLKYDTPLSDELNLSEGQKQQLTIARAMIKNSPLLILDEATSSVDTRTELVIQEAMDKLTENRTSFVIAHRLSTVRNADVILVLRDGDIAEQGNHESLLKKGGFYAELYNSQFASV